MKIIKGDLIKLTLEGQFDVIGHGCNCFCTQKNGIAKQMTIFGTDNPILFPLEDNVFKGDRKKLGLIDHAIIDLPIFSSPTLMVVNMYTQYYHKRNNPAGTTAVNFDYKAFAQCLDKLKNLALLTARERVGLPMIGSGLAGGDWDKIKVIIENTLEGLDVTIVEYEKNY